MIQLISSNTEPSHSTLLKINLINHLNKNGTEATLYGANPWPSDKCSFRPLSEFTAQKGSKILVDGIRLESRFDLINIDRYFYSHGRKKRLKQLINYALEYIFKIIPLFFSKNKIILLNPHSSQKSTHIFNTDLSKSFTSSFKEVSNSFKTSNEKEDSETIYLDICEENDVARRIEQSKAERVILAGAITSPTYYKYKIIPLLHSEKRKVEITGYQETKQQEIFDKNFSINSIEEIIKSIN